MPLTSCAGFRTLCKARHIVTAPCRTLGQLAAPLFTMLHMLLREVTFWNPQDNWGCHIGHAVPHAAPLAVPHAAREGCSSQREAQVGWPRDHPERSHRHTQGPLLTLLPTGQRLLTYVGPFPSHYPLLGPLTITWLFIPGSSASPRTQWAWTVTFYGLIQAAFRPLPFT